ncbi:MAG TPA: glycosyltransferase family 9 protein [Spirochaetota bacterium]|nr:glycosyltransferase family 9 protein [Spirochaetota bacterium]HPH02777.1 glycosyltransferase family 9 protein [Spirochaetota bacterium]HPN83080.1 glycosyltransferase family 9 protein [Spirochaetota bacterium]
MEIPRKRILVIRLSSYGDILLTTPALEYIRKMHPHASIDYVVYSHFSEMVAHHPLVDHVFAFPKKTILGLIRNRRFAQACRLLKDFFHNIRDTYYDSVIDLHSVTDSAIIALACKTRLRACNRRQLLGLLFSTKFDFPLNNEKAELHASAMALASTSKALRHSGTVPPLPRLSLTIPAFFLHEAKTILDTIRTGSGSIIGINPDASRAFKSWGHANFARLCDMLYTTYRYPIVLLGTDRALLASIRQAMVAEVHVISGTNPLTAFALVSLCDFFVSNDSGLMHVAAAFEVPQIAIFGHSNFMKFFPLSRNALSVTKNLPCSPCSEKTAKSCPDRVCINTITPEDVFARFAVLHEMLKPEHEGRCACCTHSFVGHQS